MSRAPAFTDYLMSKVSTLPEGVGFYAVMKQQMGPTGEYEYIDYFLYALSFEMAEAFADRIKGNTVNIGKVERYRGDALLSKP